MSFRLSASNGDAKKRRLAPERLADASQHIGEGGVGAEQGLEGLGLSQILHQQPRPTHRQVTSMIPDRRGRHILLDKGIS